jgi:hypothetical protein
MKIMLYLFAFINSLFLAEAGPFVESSISLSFEGFSSSKERKKSDRDKDTTKYSLDDFKEIPLDKPD